MKTKALLYMGITAALVCLFLLLSTYLCPRKRIIGDNEVKTQIATIDTSLRRETAKAETIQSMLIQQNQALIHTRTKLTEQSKQSNQRMEVARTLPPKQQLQHFNHYTGGSDTLSMQITPKDTLVALPIRQLRLANQQFAARDTLSERILLLDTLVLHQERIIALHQTMQTTLETKISLLTNRNQILQEACLQQAKALKRHKRKERITRLGIGIGFVVVVGLIL